MTIQRHAIVPHKKYKRLEIIDYIKAMSKDFRCFQKGSRHVVLEIYLSYDKLFDNQLDMAFQRFMNHEIYSYSCSRIKCLFHGTVKSIFISKAWKTCSTFSFILCLN